MLLHILSETWATLTQMAPYLLFGFVVAGLLSLLVSTETVRRHLGGGGLMPVMKSALLGVPLPLCSCGVIPVSASLRRHGAGKPATTAFLISTPQTGADSVLVTLGLLGPVFAVFRPIAALISGLIGGGAVALTQGDDQESSEPRAECEAECCSDAAGRGKLSRALHYGLVSLPRDIGKPMIVGIVLAGLISSLAPKGFFGDVLGDGLPAMLAMMVAGLSLIHI